MRCFITDMEEKYLYKKVFEEKDGKIIFLNPELAVANANEVVHQLWSCKDDVLAQRKVKTRIITKFKEIYEFDCENAVFPNPYPGQNIEEHKRKKLLVQDMYWHIGWPLFLFHKELFVNNRFKPAYAEYMTVNFQEVYEAAILDYARVMFDIPYPLRLKINETETSKEKDGLYKTITSDGIVIEISRPQTNTGRPHAVAATYILPSIIEHNLVWNLKNTVRDEWLRGLKGKPLEEAEANIYNKLASIASDRHGFIVGDMEDMLKNIWRIGRKYDILPEDTEMEKIFCRSNVMIGSILHSSYAEKTIRKEYYTILEYLFGKDKLNLSNNIAHGNSTTYDYLDICFASVMLQILQDMATGDVFLN